MKRLWTYFLFVGIFGISACHRGALRFSPGQAFETPHLEGVETIAPPLALSWTAKLDVTPGRILTALDEYILFASRDGQIVALDINTGKERWRMKDREKGEKTCAVKDSILIVAKRFGPNSLSAVHLGTGKTLWEADAGPVETEPTLARGWIIVGTDHDEIRCFDSETGRPVWVRRLEGRIRGNLTAEDTVLYAATDKSVLCALRNSDGQVIWQTHIEGAISAGPVFGDEKLFIGTQDGRFYGLGAKDGDLLWERQCEGGIFVEAAVDSECVYIGTSREILYALRLEDGRAAWQFHAGAAIGTSPVLSGRNIYFGVMDGNLMAVERTSGNDVWAYRIKGRIRTTPLVWNKHLIIGSEDRKIYGFVAEK